MIVIMLNKLELNNRKAEFDKMLVRYGKMKHSEFLKRVGETNFDPEKHGRWHPEFDLDREDITPTSFPPRPITTNQVPMKRFIEIGDPKLLEAIEKFKKSQSNGCLTDNEDNMMIASLAADSNQPKSHSHLLEIVVLSYSDQAEGARQQPASSYPRREPVPLEEIRTGDDHLRPQVPLPDEKGFKHLPSKRH